MSDRKPQARQNAESRIEIQDFTAVMLRTALIPTSFGEPDLAGYQLTVFWRGSRISTYSTGAGGDFTGLGVSPIDGATRARLSGPCAEGRMAARVSAREESPDSTRQRCRVTPGQGNLTDSATENRPPFFGRVRVKRWGKSPPRRWQQGRHGKPHWEQCQIGPPRGLVPATGYRR